ncbi:MAG: hypothetical protein K2G87_09715, partial [Oscillospiraceae bacterium]|nr:hypothetical protein [Oscillospiraceae bacterium]
MRNRKRFVCSVMAVLTAAGMLSACSSGAMDSGSSDGGYYDGGYDNYDGGYDGNSGNAEAPAADESYDYAPQATYNAG